MEYLPGGSLLTPAEGAPGAGGGLATEPLPEALARTYLRWAGPWVGP
jgi:hypothetical protein